MQQSKLIAHYENILSKVQEAYGDSDLKVDYVEKAKENLEAVKNGRAW